MTSKVQTKTVSNAYNLLKEGQRNLSLESVKYPEKMGSETNSRDDFRLYSDIIDLLQENGHGFIQVCATCKAEGAIFRVRNNVKTAQKRSAKTPILSGLNLNIML